MKKKNTKLSYRINKFMQELKWKLTWKKFEMDMNRISKQVGRLK